MNQSSGVTGRAQQSCWCLNGMGNFHILFIFHINVYLQRLTYLYSTNINWICIYCVAFPEAMQRNIYLIQMDRILIVQGEVYIQVQLSDILSLVWIYCDYVQDLLGRYTVGKFHSLLMGCDTRKKPCSTAAFYFLNISTPKTHAARTRITYN